MANIALITIMSVVFTVILCLSGQYMSEKHPDDDIIHKIVLVPPRDLFYNDEEEANMSRQHGPDQQQRDHEELELGITKEDKLDDSTVESDSHSEKAVNRYWMTATPSMPARRPSWR